MIASVIARCGVVWSMFFVMNFTSSAAAADKPNVVVLLMDDFDWGEPHQFNAAQACLGSPAAGASDRCALFCMQFAVINRPVKRLMVFETLSRCGPHPCGYTRPYDRRDPDSHRGRVRRPQCRGSTVAPALCKYSDTRFRQRILAQYP